jgi:hypothetical protein
MGSLAQIPRRRGLFLIAALLLAGVAGLALPPLVGWQKMGQERALSLSNIRRLGTAFLIYSQDWDGRPMPLTETWPNGEVRGWPQALRPYVSPVTVFSNPSNPVTPFHSMLHSADDGHAIDSSYAFNRRFWNTFAPGPFPIENLEMPEQTALFVEAGPLRSNPRHPLPRDAHSPDIALDLYGDTTDRINGLSPYPSTHGEQMAVVAADGHGLMIKVEHYSAADGNHDPLYGRLGGSIYNWNGGHSNGETDRPARE